MDEVQSGNYVVVQDLKGRRSIIQAGLKGCESLRKLKIARQFVPASALISLRYGIQYELANGVIAPAETSEIPAFESGGEVVGDNRGLVDDNQAQGLSAEEIKTMKDTFGGRKVIEELINNSSTFAGKTQLSKEKYLKKKKAKYRLYRHLCEFLLIKTTSFHIAETFFEQRKCLRPDVLANVVTLSNVNYASKVLLFEDMKGILAGVFLQRSLQPVTSLYHGDKPKLAFLNFFNLRPEDKARLRCVTLEMLTGKFSALVISSNYDPKSTLEALLPFLQPAAQVVVHSYTAHFLAECEQWLIRSGLCIDVRIEEFMTRKYQVLPARTHPMMSSTGHGGYLLSCIAVTKTDPETKDTEPAETKVESEESLDF